MRLTVFLLKVLHQLTFSSWSIGWMISSVVEWPLVCSALNISQDSSIKVSQMQLLGAYSQLCLPYHRHSTREFHSISREIHGVNIPVCLILGLS